MDPSITISPLEFTTERPFHLQRQQSKLRQLGNSRRMHQKSTFYGANVHAVVQDVLKSKTKYRPVFFSFVKMSLFVGPKRSSPSGFLEALMEEADKEEHKTKWSKRTLDTCAPSDFVPKPNMWIKPDDVEIRGLAEQPEQLGVFAVHPLGAGKIICEYVGERKTVNNLQVKTHAIRVPGTPDTVIDGIAQRGTSDTRAAGALINSTYDPASRSKNRHLANVKPEWTGPPECRCFMVSTRDIEAGEQVLWFYSF